MSRYQAGPAVRPEGVALALLVTGGALGTLVLALPNVAAVVKKMDPIKIIFRPLPKDPPPPREQHPVRRETPQREAQARDEQVALVKPLVARPDAAPVLDGSENPLPPGEKTIAEGGGGGVAFDPPALPKPPVIVPPRLDPRFADRLQPGYPAGELRLGTEGRVVVRVLVGADGRVKAVERISAASDGLFEATRDQALKRWRFLPGTRDGVASEAWYQVAVVFRIDSQ